MRLLPLFLSADQAGVAPLRREGAFDFSALWARCEKPVSHPAAFPSKPYRVMPSFPSALCVVDLLAGATALLTTSCASLSRDAAAAERPAYVLNQSQYETVVLTGSRLPVLMPTAGTVTPIPRIFPITVISGDSYYTATRVVRGPLVVRNAARRVDARRALLRAG